MLFILFGLFKKIGKFQNSKAKRWKGCHQDSPTRKREALNGHKSAGPESDFAPAFQQ